MTTALTAGLLVLHGNRLESLRDAVVDWLGRHPLDPLEEEHFLVQSNGAAEWLKMSLARANGICAATRVESPGRFLWRAYRDVLGRERVQPRSALERQALAWRLMRVLPEVVERPSFEPVAQYLREHRGHGDGGANDGADGGLDRRLQLARRLADLYDQYQVYRGDWLAGWEARRATLATADGERAPMPLEQRWQAELWRALVAELSRDERRSIRPHVHRAFVEALAADDAAIERSIGRPSPADGGSIGRPSPADGGSIGRSSPADGGPIRRPSPADGGLPRRVVLFGASHASAQTLEALAALSTRVQVIVAVPNPSRFHWADIIDGREALHAARRRLPSPGGVDLASVPLDAMHLHAHPLLAMWGRQGRDFMRLLDAFDDGVGAAGRFDVPRVDLFDDGPGTTMLAQVQAAIRDLVPLSEQPVAVVDHADRSIVFHVGHGPQREVEILHDQLLALLADGRADAGADPLRPRDVVVMVPDIEVFAPSVRAVFGQYPRDDARHVPFEIADLRSRGSNPLVVAVEWLLRIPEKRVTTQEVRDLLDVPAIAARFGLDDEALPGLFGWLAGAGVRWGLDAAHRERLGLGAAGSQNTWSFGLARMLLGYAAGDAAPYAGIDPYDEIGGLDAAAVGALAACLERLDEWRTSAATVATPAVWASRGRALLAAMVAPSDARETLTVAALQTALAEWLEACDAARFGEAVPLSVFREAWLDGIDARESGGRFLAGGVTFCTLMPLRSVPFAVVCLLGMNDGDFPRRTPTSDFDLMALPGQRRPGDRSRRDDDRYLMLEALLSARRVLYVGWSGRSARDNTVQPPSVLVAQLCDYLSARWREPDGSDVVAARTTVHPLQPFGRRYFEAGGPTTYAREWRAAHAAALPASTGASAPQAAVDDDALTLAELARFVKNPVKAFFRARLGVVVGDGPDALDDDEAFVLDPLGAYQMREALLRAIEDVDADAIDTADADAIDTADADAIDTADRGTAPGDEIRASVERRLARIVASGALPMFDLGRRVADDLRATVVPMLDRWMVARRALPHAAEPLPLAIVLPAARIADRLAGVRSDGRRLVRLSTSPSRLLDADGALRIDKLADPWLATLAAAAAGHVVETRLIAADATLSIAPADPGDAAAMLATLLRAWRDGMIDPLPFAIRTALAAAAGTGRPSDTYDGKAGNRTRRAVRGDREEFCLGRAYPDFDALAADGRFAACVASIFVPMRDWARDAVTVVEVAKVVDVGGAVAVDDEALPADEAAGS